MKQIVASVAITTVALTNLASAQETPFKSRFDGVYAGVTFGYGFNNAKNGVWRSPYAYYPDLELPIVPPDNHEGAKIGFLVGYNARFDNLMLGVEGRTQYSFGVTRTNTHYKPAAFNPNDFQALEATFSSERVNPLQFDLAFRAGYTFGNWMIYAKLGGGIEQFRTKVTSDWSRTLFCTTSPCTTSEPGSVLTSSGNRWTGYGLTGVGIERNFGSVFARVEAELIAHEIAYYTGAANFTLGYRF